MDHNFLELYAREKMKDYTKEGLSSQAVYRSGAPRASLWSALPKSLLVFLGLAGLWVVFLR